MMCQGPRGPSAVAGTVRIRVTWKDGFKNTRCHRHEVVEQCIGITERKEELFVHIFQPLRTVFRPFLGLGLCVCEAQDAGPGRVNVEMARNAREPLDGAELFALVTLVLFINTPAM